MFTGIVEETGTIERILSSGGGLRFAIGAESVISDLKAGDSISVDGACLTVVGVSPGAFEVEAAEETLKKTTLGNLNVRDIVNLERSMLSGGRLGGHIVQGHVDGVGEIVGYEEREGSWMFKVRIPEEFCQYVITQGSIALNGVSLTVAEINPLRENEITFSIIPYTYQHTTFKKMKGGDKVNLEFDVIGKYVKRFLEPTLTGKEGKSKITSEWLKELGY